MKRRHFASLAAAPVLASARPAAAQDGPVEGRHFVQLKQPLPTAPGKIEVVEFFWYGCPHCAVFETALRPWLAQLPPDVSFRYAHVAFRASMQAHQRMFFALQAIGREAELRAAVFKAIHRENLPLSRADEQASWLGGFGVDRRVYLDAYNSFSVQTQCKQATKLSEDFQIEGVPELGIGGRFRTAPSMASGGEPLPEVELGFRALAVADILIQRLRAPH